MFLGILCTFIIALIAKLISSFSFFQILGPLLLSILIGMSFSTFSKVPKSFSPGFQFSSKFLLRFGIILLGMRLNLSDIYHAGPWVFGLSFFCLLFGILVVYYVSRLFKVDKEIGLLLACGTGICGAAAIIAVSSQTKSPPEKTAISVAIIAVVGTIFSILYTTLFPVLSLSPESYGLLSGTTLHEIAHVIAAANPAGSDALNIALVSKLTRVTLLIGVILFLSFWKNDTNKGGKRNLKNLPIPWFILGFLGMSILHTTGIVPETITKTIVDFSYLLMGMAMAGLGLQVRFQTLQKNGLRPFFATLSGSVLLSIFGYVLITL